MEGIEHAGASEVATALGARYGQGFLSSRPREAASFLKQSRHELVHAG